MGKQIEKICPNCSEKFTTTTVQKKFCSKNCYRRSRERPCKICGKTISDYKIYCEECKSKKDFSRGYYKEKFCKSCSTVKHYEEFRQVNKSGKNKNKHGGWRDIERKLRYHKCSKCESIESQKKYRADGSRQRFYTIKKRATEKGIPFDLTVEDFKTLFDNAGTHCPILGIKFEHREVGSKDTSKQTHSAPSIDRIDPKKGYVKGNVMVMSALANRIKTDATIDEIEKVLNFLKKHAEQN